MPLGLFKLPPQLTLLPFQLARFHVAFLLEQVGLLTLGRRLGLQGLALGKLLNPLLFRSHDGGEARQGCRSDHCPHGHVIAPY